MYGPSDGIARNAAPEGGDAIDSPTAEDCVSHSMSVAHKALPAPDRQVNPITYGEVVRHIVRTHRVFRVRMIVVLGRATENEALIQERAGRVGVGFEFRVGIGKTEDATRAKPLHERGLQRAVVCNAAVRIHL